MILKYNDDAFDQVFEKIDDLRMFLNYFKVSHIFIFNGSPSKNTDLKTPLVVSFFTRGVLIYESEIRTLILIMISS